MSNTSVIEPISENRPESPIFIPGRFQKGISGNPGGRPKSRLISESLRKQLAEAAKKNDPILADKLAKKLVKIALSAKDGISLAAITEIADRTEGKAMQSHRIETGIDNTTAQAILALAERLLPPTQPTTPLTIEATFVSEGNGE